MQAELRYLHRSPQSAVASCGEVSIFMVYTDVTIEALQASISLSQEIRKKYPAVLSITIASARARVPTAEVREESSKAMIATQDSARCAAVVLSGDGFWYSAMRSALTAIDLVRPYPVPRKVFAQLRPAALWMASYAQQPNAAWVNEVTRACTQVYEGA
jgi:hypothetical protein